MQGLFHPWRTRLAVSSVGAVLLALSMAFTAPAFAIPTNGTYDVSGGFFNGYFTVANSTLTDYSFTVSSLSFSDESQFNQFFSAVPDQTVIDNSLSERLVISWSINQVNWYSQRNSGQSSGFAYTLRPSSVPEPSSALMAGLGLLLLLGYGWRQRRQAGLQVG
jgi:MYXO-CTERM domain-containing protein